MAAARSEKRFPPGNPGAADRWLARAGKPCAKRHGNSVSGPMNAITNTGGSKPGERAQDMPGTRCKARGKARGNATGKTRCTARGKTRGNAQTARTRVGLPASCDANPAARPRIDASAMCLPVQKGQRIRRRMKAHGAVSGRLDIRTFPAWRDRHWLPRKKRLPEESRVYFPRRAHSGAGPVQ